MDIHNLLKEYLHRNMLMQLATVADGNPWICNVYFVTDDASNIYWTSAKSRRHSQEILSNPKVAVSIVNDPNMKQALQITGLAYKVEPDAVDHVNKLYGDKFGDKPLRLQEVLADTPGGRAYWVVKPTTISF
jgi:uncharacterized protein YhbP (UPF0306 family)